MRPAHSSTPDSPFVGVRAFAAEDWPFFFGRETEASTLAGSLLGSSVTVLYGSPGSGKSSLIGAALPHRLAAATNNKAILRRWSRWQVDFLTQLKQEVGRALATEVGFHSAVARWAERGDGELFLLFDQFEEYFRYTRDPIGNDFARELALIANDPTFDIHVLISLREDSLSLLDRLRVRIPNILDTTMELRPLDKDSARLSILGPLEAWRKYGWPGPAADPDDKFIEKLLRQSDNLALRRAASGAVATKIAAAKRTIEAPFLQLALQRVWQKDKESRAAKMRTRTLDSVGGVLGIIRQHLAAAVGALDSEQSLLAARMFRYLVTPSGGKNATNVVTTRMRASVTSPRRNRLRDAAGFGAVMEDRLPCSTIRLGRFMPEFQPLLAPA